MSFTADEGRFVEVKFCGDAKPDWTKLAFYTTPEYASTQPDRPGDRILTFFRGAPVGRVAWPVANQNKFGVDSWNVDAAPTVISNKSADTPNDARLRLNIDSTLDDKIARPMIELEEWSNVFNEDLPDGTEGIMLRGVELGTVKNNLFYPAWGNSLIAHHNDDEPPTMSTFVYDMAGSKKSETYKARLNSDMWVKLLPKEDGCAGTDDEPAIAWNCTQSRGEATGWGLATFLAKETKRVEEPKKTITGKKRKNKKPSKQSNKIKLLEFVEFGAAKNVQAWCGFEQFGFIHPGDPENDKHAFHRNSDGERTNSAHIWTNAYFYMNKVMDGPINFIPAIKPPVARGPIPTDVLILWNPAIEHSWKCGPKDGKWDPMTFQPNFTKEPRDPKKPPPTDWTPLEREGPSWYPIPKPCVLKGEGGRRRPTDATEDSVFDATGVSSTDWAKAPRIAHIVATGKIAVTVANPGKRGIAACPPDYTVPPIKGGKKKPPVTGGPDDGISVPGVATPNDPDAGISVPGVATPIPTDAVPTPPQDRSGLIRPDAFSVVNALNSYVQGTSIGVLWHAEPELEDYQLHHGFDLMNVTVSVSTYGIHNKNILGFGRASDDFGSVVDGFRMQLDGSKNLCITPVDEDGVTDSKSVVFKGDAQVDGNLNVGPTAVAVAPGDLAAGGLTRRMLYDESAGSLGLYSSAGALTSLISGTPSAGSKIGNWLNVGVGQNRATASGDLAVGKSFGGAELLFDASAQTLTIYDSGNNADIVLNVNGESKFVNDFLIESGGSVSFDALTQSAFRRGKGLTGDSDLYAEDGGVTRIVQTTDATVQNLDVYGMATDSAVHFETTFVCVETNGSTAASIVVRGLARKDGAAGATLVDSVEVYTKIDEVAIAADVVVSGNNIRLQFNGVAATTLNWVVTTHITQTK